MTDRHNDLASSLYFGLVAAIAVGMVGLIAHLTFEWIVRSALAGAGPWPGILVVVAMWFGFTLYFWRPRD